MARFCGGVVEGTGNITLLKIKVDNGSQHLHPTFVITVCRSVFLTHTELSDMAMLFGFQYLLLLTVFQG